MSPPYQSEQCLVRDFLGALSTDENPWGASLPTAEEFDYQRGRTDVVGLSPSGDVLAFEAKLDRWRVALDQAYRNTCFAHRSYVVLPEAAARRASARLDEFARRGVGLCYVTCAGLVLVQEAKRQEPVQPWLAQAATDRIAGSPGAA